MHIVIGIIVALVVLVLLSSGVLIMLDYMARGFLWVFPVEPVIGWLLMGALLGGLVGLAAGYRRGGRPLGALGPTLPIIAATLLLVAGANYPGARGAQAAASTAFQVRVTSEELNVRAQPDREAAQVGKLTQGTVVEVAEASGEWYRVVPSGTHPGGWINGKYVVTVQGAPPVVLVPATDTVITTTTVTTAPVQPAARTTAATDSEPREARTPPLPPAPAIPSLQGRWRGRFDGYAARLNISWQDGSQFSGTLESEASKGPDSKGTYRIAVEGSVDADGSVELRETSVLSEPPGYQWNLGYNTGTLSPARTSLSGHGNAGGSPYEWFFEKY
jgi:hypothetical protein